ncbi:MAG: YgjV family protein [Bacteroidetes bacterium]|nr:YgjV family protein [Bacteroidota bacterium]
MEVNITEIIGYIASFVVLLSFLMKDMLKLRLVNFAGCSLFVAYGIMLQYSIPIILTNSVILMIHVYYLLKMRKEKK